MIRIQTRNAQESLLRILRADPQLKKETDQVYRVRLVKAAAELSEEDFERLSDEAQVWVNAATTAMNKGQDILDFEGEALPVKKLRTPKTKKANSLLLTTSGAEFRKALKAATELELRRVLENAPNMAGRRRARLEAAWKVRAGVVNDPIPEERIISLEFKEHEWERVFEVQVPNELLWLAGVNMQHPVQFAKQDLSSLAIMIWSHLGAVKKPYERRVFNRILDKMYTALEPCAGKRQSSTPLASPPNDKETALRIMPNLRRVVGSR